MNIRSYREDDFAALCQIFLRAVRETASQHYTPAQVAAWAQVDEVHWRQRLAASRVRVTTQGDRPVGFITAVDGYIDLLFVAPDFSRQCITEGFVDTDTDGHINGGCQHYRQTVF